MKLAKHDFKQLQEEWYQKLYDAGFKDIEVFKGDDLILAQYSQNCYRNVDEFTRQLKESYFICISQCVNDKETVFRNNVDRYIMTRHAEGALINEIMQELAKYNISKDRKTIRIMIRRYEMAWGIRSYERCQLHLKKKP